VTFRYRDQPCPIVEDDHDHIGSANTARSAVSWVNNWSLRPSSAVNERCRTRSRSSLSIWPVTSRSVLDEPKRTSDRADFSTHSVVARQDSGPLDVAAGNYHRREIGKEFATPPASAVGSPALGRSERYDSRLSKRLTMATRESYHPDISRRTQSAYGPPAVPHGASIHHRTLASLSKSRANATHPRKHLHPQGPKERRTAQPITP
jgi:hypothetical protein